MDSKLILCLLAILCGCSTVLIILNPILVILSMLLLLGFTLFSLKLLKDSQTDSLTGVSNLRGLDNLRHHYHHVKVLTVIYLDVNELKQLNDNQGHETGNMALKEVAASMLQVAGDNGQVYRVGGDEFILISEDKDPSHVIDHWNSEITMLCHVGISYGFASGDGTQLDGLIRTAERNMYTMKRSR